MPKYIQEQKKNEIVFANGILELWKKNHFYFVFTSRSVGIIAFKKGTQ